MSADDATSPVAAQGGGDEGERSALALARNIVNQILDESGASVKRRQAINDDCDRFVSRLLADRDRATKAAALREAADALTTFAEETFWRDDSPFHLSQRHTLGGAAAGWLRDRADRTERR